MSFVLMQYEGDPDLYVRPTTCVRQYDKQGKAVVKSCGTSYLANILGYFTSRDEAENVCLDLQKTVIVQIPYEESCKVKQVLEEVVQPNDFPNSIFEISSRESLSVPSPEVKEIIPPSGKVEESQNITKLHDTIEYMNPGLAIINSDPQLVITNMQQPHEDKEIWRDISTIDISEIGEELRSKQLSDEVIIEYVPYDVLLDPQGSTTINEKQLSDPPSEIINVEEISCEKKGHKYPSKKHCCIFCHKLVTKIGRHLTSVHHDEPEVIELSSYPLKDEKRLRLIEKLRKSGDFHYNQQLLKSDDISSLISIRRSRRTKDKQNFVPCPHCLGTYSKFAIRFHARKCIPNQEKNSRSLQQRCRQTLSHVHKRASEVMKTKILPSLHSDHIGETVRRDELIIIFGNNLSRKYRAPHQAEMIRARLRLLARFVLIMRRLNSTITDLKSSLELKHLNNIITAVEEIGQLGKSDSKYKSPSSAFVLAGYLKHAAKLQSMEYIMNDDEEKARKIDTLIKFMEESFNSSINPIINETLSEAARRNKVQLPSTDSVRKYILFVENKIEHLMHEINTKRFTGELWLQLASYTLTAIQAFNRKRPGEVQRILIEDFLAYQAINCKKDKELYESFSQEEKQQAQKYVRVELRGKKGRNTALLMNQLHLSATLLLLKLRPNMNISPENKFLFGVPSSTKKFATLDAYKIMKSCSQECGLDDHNLIRGNTLRKHVATVMALNKNRGTFSKERLSDFMSHSLEVHKNVYEVSSSAVEITHVSKILEEALESKRNQKENISTEPSNSSHTSSSCIESAAGPGMDLEINHTPKKASATSANVATYKDYSFDKDSEYIPEETSPSTSSTNTPMKCKRKISTPIFAEGKARRRLTWSTPERSLARATFQKNIHTGKIPSSEECKQFMRHNKAVFSNSNVQRIKTWIGHQHHLLFNNSRSWKTPEKTLVKTAFRNLIETNNIPSYLECAKLRAKHRQVLKNRSPMSIKSFVVSEIKRCARSKLNTC